MKRQSLFLSLIAVGVSMVALFGAPTSPLKGKGLDAYDVSTPEAAYQSMMEMNAAGDLRALMELNQLQLAERVGSLKIEDSVPYDGKVILFLSYQQDGKTKYETQGMKKLPDTDTWVHDFVSSYTLEGKNAKLAKRMRSWEANGPAESAEAPIKAR